MANSIDLDYEIKIKASIKSPLISVIIPVFNVVKSGFFNDLLESIKRQGVLPVEYVFADDASTDESLKYCIDFAKSRSDVTVLHLLENCQRGGALNRCIKESAGEYIALLDSDDYVSDGYFRIFCETIENNDKPDAVVPEYLHFVNGESESLYPPSKNTFLEDSEGIIDAKIRRELILNHWMFGAWKTTILIDGNNFFPEKMFFEDTPTLILWLLTIKDFRIAYEATHFFRQHSASATAGAVFSGKKLDDRIKSSDLILVNAKKMNCYELYKDEFDFYYVFVCLYNTLMKLVENPLDKTTILNLEKHVKKTVPQFKQNKYVKARASFPGYPSWYLMRAAYNNPFIFATIYRALRRVYYCFKR